MSIALVQSASNSSSSANSLTVTFSSGTTAGNCIVVVSYTEFATTGVTLVGSSDTFTQRAVADDGASSNSIFLHTDAGCSSGHTQVTVTYIATGPVYAIAYEFSGLYISDVLDKALSNSHTTAATTWTSGTTATTTVANELWFGAVVTSSSTPTGPSSPWVNTASGALADSAHVLTGYDIVSSTGNASYAGTVSPADEYGALVVTLKGAVASTGSSAMSSVTMAASGSVSYPTSGSAAMSTISMAGSSVSALPFPTNVLGVKIELLLNGTWTDITSYVYQRDNIVITGRGRADETTSVQPTTMALTLNNRMGQFTPKNASGQFYPYLTRNTQIRASVATASTTGKVYQGYRFYGEVSSWPPQWDPTGTDVYVHINANGILRRLNQNSALIGYTLDQYETATLQGVNAPLGYWPVTDTDGSTEIASALPNGSAMTVTGTPAFAQDTSFGGLGPFAQLKGSSWSGTPFAFSTTGADTYSTPGTYTWSCPPGVTSVQVECWGAGASAGEGESGPSLSPNFNGGGGGGGGEYASESTLAVTPGTDYTVVVAAGGSNASGAVTAGGNSTFTGASPTVIAHGAPGNDSFAIPGTGGTGSTNTVHFDGGAGGAGSGNNDPALIGGGGGGGSAGASGAGGTGGNASGGTAGTGGAAGSGGGAAGGSGASAATGHIPQNGNVPGSGGGGGDSYLALSGTGGAGKVKVTYVSSSTPYANVLRFALDVPAAGGVNGAIYGQMLTSGTVAKVNVIYGTGGTLQIIGYNGGGTPLFTSTAAGAYNGVPIIVSAELTPSGTSVAWALKTIPAGKGQTATTLASGTTTSASVGQVSTVNINPGATETGDTAIGGVILQHFVTSLPDLAYAASGYNDELAADRFVRLCAQANVTSTLVGNSGDTPAMGPQPNDTLVNVLQSVENVDCGLLYETRDNFGLSYRTRVDMQNQLVKLPLDYSAAEIGISGTSLQPTYDDQYIRNDVTVSRTGGSSARVADESGSMSVSQPPNGVGDYTYSRTVNAFADSQLSNEASWLLSLGTIDDERYPQIPIDLSRTELANLLDVAAELNIGDFVQVTNMPSFMGETSTSQLAWGMSEVLNAFIWQIVINAVPEVPYETVLTSNPYFTGGSTTGWIAFNGSIAAVPPPPGLPAGDRYTWACQYTNSGGTAGALEASTAGSFAAVPSTTYTLQCWVYSTVASVSVGFDWRNSGHSFLSSSTQTFTVTPRTWTRLVTTQTSVASTAFAVARAGSATLGAVITAASMVAVPGTDIW